MLGTTWLAPARLGSTLIQSLWQHPLEPRPWGRDGRRSRWDRASQTLSAQLDPDRPQVRKSRALRRPSYWPGAHGLQTAWACLCPPGTYSPPSNTPGSRHSLGGSRCPPLTMAPGWPLPSASCGSVGNGSGGAGGGVLPTSRSRCPRLTGTPSPQHYCSNHRSFQGLRPGPERGGIHRAPQGLWELQLWADSQALAGNPLAQHAVKSAPRALPRDLAAPAHGPWRQKLRRAHLFSISHLSHPDHRCWTEAR